MTRRGRIRDMAQDSHVQTYSYSESSQIDMLHAVSLSEHATVARLTYS